jgi:hypothetical protein
MVRNSVDLPHPENDELARLDVEVHILEHLYIAVALVKIGDLEVRHGSSLWGYALVYRAIPI